MNPDSRDAVTAFIVTWIVLAAVYFIGKYWSC